MNKLFLILFCFLIGILFSKELQVKDTHFDSVSSEFQQDLDIVTDGEFSVLADNEEKTVSVIILFSTDDNELEQKDVLFISKFLESSLLKQIILIFCANLSPPFSGNIQCCS